MKIDVDEKGNLRLTEVFNSITLETEDGEKLYIAMRDGGFEMAVLDTSAKSETPTYSHYTIRHGQATEHYCNEPAQSQTSETNSNQGL